MDTPRSATRLLAELQKGIDQACDEARRDLSDRLNRSLRRLRQADSVSEWNSALVDAAGGFSAHAALFTVTGTSLKGTGALRGVEVLLAAAPAFASAVDSADTVVSIRTARQISAKIAGAFGEAAEVKVYLFPIVVRQKGVAVLYAEGPVDVSVLELLATAAAAWWGRPSPPGDGHLRAQRFALVEVARMRLYKAPAVESGRACQNLYAELKDDIDSARETFRRQFAAGASSMVDYLHMELVRTLANDDASLLGPDYPGPLA